MLDRIAVGIMTLAFLGSIFLMLPYVEPFPENSLIVVTLKLIGTSLAFIDPWVNTLVLINLTILLLSIVSICMLTLGAKLIYGLVVK